MANCWHETLEKHVIVYTRADDSYRKGRTDTAIEKSIDWKKLDVRVFRLSKANG